MLVSRRSRLIAVPIGLLLLLASAAPVLGHNPTEGTREYPGDNTVIPVCFAANVPQWLHDEVFTALVSDWQTNNNTRSPVFGIFATCAAGYTQIKWQTPATAPTAECPNQFYYACTDYFADGSYKYTIFNSANPSGSRVSYFCQAPGQADSNCADVRRVMLHEAGHGVGLSRGSNGQHHQPDGTNPVYTVMTTNPYFAPVTNWNRRVLGTCDLFDLSRDYDVDNTAGFAQAIPDCEDHVGAPAVVGGHIVTDTVQDTTSTGGCINEGVTLTGTLQLINTGSLGLLANNGLAARTVNIYRRPAGGSYSLYTTATVVAGSSGNWSRTVSSGAVATFVFQARFAPTTAGDVATLNASSSGEKTVVWSGPAC